VDCLFSKELCFSGNISLKTLINEGKACGRFFSKYGILP
jgi:hypothetical protein